jgi:hypothetical protein
MDVWVSTFYVVLIVDLMLNGVQFLLKIVECILSLQDSVVAVSSVVSEWREHGGKGGNSSGCEFVDGVKDFKDLQVGG